MINFLETKTFAEASTIVTFGLVALTGRYRNAIPDIDLYAAAAAQKHLSRMSAAPLSEG